MSKLTRAIFEENATDQLLPVMAREPRFPDYDRITHYHADYVNPSWGRKIDRIGKIGRHIFYTSKRVTRSLSEDRPAKRNRRMLPAWRHLRAI